MPNNKPKRSAPKAKKSPGKRKARDSRKMIFIIFALVGVMVLVEMASIFLKSVSDVTIPIPVRPVLEFNGDSQPCGPFKAWDVLALPNGEIALTDVGNSRILVFSDQGKLLREIDKKKAGNPEFNEISCITADPSGNLYVIEPWNGLIRGFDPKGDLVLKLDLHNKGFYGPRGLAWDQGSFLVADTGSHRVVKLSDDGTVELTWGKQGSAKGSFNNPSQVVTDGQGNCDVVDQGNNRIQVFDRLGHFVREIRLDAVPAAEAVDPQRKLLYISSTDGKYVKAYNSDGKYVGTLTIPGQANQLEGVNALSVMSNGDIVACKQDKIDIYHPVPSTAGH